MKKIGSVADALLRRFVPAAAAAAECPPVCGIRCIDIFRYECCRPSCGGEMKCTWLGDCCGGC